MALVYRDSVKCTPVDIGQYVQFEYLAAKIVGRQSSAVVVCVHRQPDGLASTFLDKLADMFDQLTLLNSQFIIVGDFNAPGPTAGKLDRRVMDVFMQHGLYDSTLMVETTLAATFST